MNNGGRPTLIASMVTIWSRRGALQRVIDGISRQSRPPDLLRLHYSRTRWFLDEGWRHPPRVRADFPIELCEVPNVGSARKYLSTLAAYRNDDVYVVLVDDDIVWAPYVFEQTLKHAVRTGGVASTHGWGERADWPGRPASRFELVLASRVSRPREAVIASSGSATTFHVRHVDPRLFDRRLHRRYGLRYSDEIFLNAMLPCRKSIIPLPAGFFEKIKNERDQWRQPRSFEAKVKQFALLERSVQRWRNKRAAVVVRV